MFCGFFFKQKTAYELRISDWSSDVCSSDLINGGTGNDYLQAGAGNDTVTQTGSTGGRDIVDGGAGTDTFVLNGVAGAETFRIYARAEAEAAGITGLSCEETRVGKESGSTCRFTGVPYQ